MYCLKCKRDTVTVDSNLVATSNNRLLLKGKCADCGTKKAQFQKGWKRGKKGSGLFNKIIDKLPVELHIPGYNYCGPGTKLSKRLAKGDVGVNALDEACKRHDVAYAASEDLADRHRADEELASAARKILLSNTGLSERVAAAGVTGAMKAKVKLGMGKQ